MPRSRSKLMLEFFRLIFIPTNPSDEFVALKEIELFHLVLVLYNVSVEFFDNMAPNMPITIAILDKNSF